ncbi:MAG: hypothetical protein DMG14_03135 [Acidobacteria bacterium]|nr:MAG: hypothetical protein DMG14_03135 [Acidobacteriota bacterium]
MLKQESTPTDTAELAARARAAYEQHRIRECLALAKALAQADPGNAEVLALHSAIRADIQRDLKDARALLEQSGDGKDERKKYGKAADIILLKTLHLDPENQHAKILLQCARGLADLPQAPPEPEEIPFVASPLLSEKEQKRKGRSKLPLTLMLIGVLAGGLLLILRSRVSHSNALGSSGPRPEAFDPRELQRPVAVTQEAPSPAPDPAVSATTLVSTVGVQAPVAAVPAPAATASLITPVASNGGVDAPPGIGKLAVSSPTPAEIYVGDRYMRSTPTTVQLTAGHRPVEYRHGDLRTVVFHDIKPNQTTMATGTFQLTVQVNAKPSAQVFLDGETRRPLGQTPLSGITVPIGGVLVFENPNFTSKSYRITEKDSAIQVSFP